MERRIPVVNNTKMTMFVGSIMIPAGETRDIPESHVPAHLLPQKEEVKVEPEPPEDRIAALLENNVGTVIAALPALTAEEIERLGELEQAGQARKGVLGPIAEILLKSAAAPEGAAPAAPAEGAAPEGAPA